MTTSRESAGDNRECPGANPDLPHYGLRLFVTGMTPRSTEAIARIKAICEEFLAGRYLLEVIDIYQQPLLARAEQIIATPTLIKTVPAPFKRLVGDLSNRQRVLLALDLQEKS
ncbi:circadian clock KaiB family protein [Lignipirellula cremea]|uniref:Circadian clock protein KaiB n=1 Tax=Lignipirellula cremea TaxID=2528010 RepID=A0A518E106_9BACT|nr:circadian clock KaiB family protein [Lignipirellula cremea]QDU97776.1 Circadian clock protein KaiB [Lignipirellula cremea]